ncbi:MAG TPA: hypothetical protein VFU21_29680 [Kofleriaceae bacterium]|nr:hypothetical protein [Kofleriaceae bacterium]
MLARVLALALALTAACSHVSTVRLQEEAVEVGPGLRPLAAIQANAISGYFLFIPLPGVDLDRVVNQLLVVAAKTMGADKVVLLDFDATPAGGIWAWRKLIGWRSARATGIAVQVTSPAADPHADEGPEPPPPAAPVAPPASGAAPAPGAK